MVNKQYTVQNNQSGRNYSPGIKRFSPQVINSNHCSPSLGNNLDIHTDSFSRNNMHNPNVRASSSSQNSDNVSEHALSVNGKYEATDKLHHGYLDKEEDINKIGRFQYIVQMDHEMVRTRDNINNIYFLKFELYYIYNVSFELYIYMNTHQLGSTCSHIMRHLV